MDDVCQEEWQTLLLHLSGVRDIIDKNQLQFLNCSQPGSPLGELPHCCSDAGVMHVMGELHIIIILR